MNIGITLIVEIINFALFIYFFKKVLWKPLMGVMEARQKRIADGLAAADSGQAALQQAAVKREETLQAARTQAQDILSSAHKQASQIVDQARETAKGEGQRILAQAQAEVQREAAAVRESLRRDVGRLAVLGAARILKREIDPSAHAKVLDTLAQEI
ncbi:MAG: F0F1 ATP synthase subunit B [Stenotrophobium sp.]